MKNCADYIAAAKAALGDERMSDKALGRHLGYAQQTIAKGRQNRMSDQVALAIGELLVRHRVIEHAGEVVLIAHAERDADEAVRQALTEYAARIIDGRAPRRRRAARAAPRV